MQTKIPWCEETWNPFEGCSPVSAGCARCYAARFANRFRGVEGSPFEGLVKIGPIYPTFNGQVRVVERRLTEPVGKSSRVYFVNSRSDTFHLNVPARRVIELFETMAACPQHTFLVLTKRPERIEPILYGSEGGYYLGRNDYLPNVWLGISVEKQLLLDQRASLLFEAGPEWRYFLSNEPMLGPLDARRYLRRPGAIGFDWVICGGESGPDPRPVYPNWPRALHTQCEAADVPFFFKQWGGYHPSAQAGPRSIGIYEDGTITKPHSVRMETGEPAMLMARYARLKSGREIDGREYLETPRFDVWRTTPKLALGRAA
jgi:protein gp37